MQDLQQNLSTHFYRFNGGFMGKWICFDAFRRTSFCGDSKRPLRSAETLNARGDSKCPSQARKTWAWTPKSVFPLKIFKGRIHPATLW